MRININKKEVIAIEECNVLVRAQLMEIHKADNQDKAERLTYSFIEEFNKNIKGKITDDEKEEMLEVLSEIGVEIRVCDACGDLMHEGYYLGDAWEYYCSDECLHTEVSPQEWKKMTAHLIDEEDRTEEEDEWVNEYGEENYWTQWM